MRIKPGVRVRGLKPEAVIALIVAKGVYEAHGYECVLTSGTDGSHSSGSYHYTGEAIDLRLPPADSQLVRDELAERLGADYDVILESDHIHCEHDPD